MRGTPRQFDLEAELLTSEAQVALDNGKEFVLFATIHNPIGVGRVPARTSASLEVILQSSPEWFLISLLWLPETQVPEWREGYRVERTVSTTSPRNRQAD